MIQHRRTLSSCRKLSFAVVFLCAFALILSGMVVAIEASSYPENLNGDLYRSLSTSVSVFALIQLPLYLTQWFGSGLWIPSKNRWSIVYTLCSLFVPTIFAWSLFIWGVSASLDAHQENPLLHQDLYAVSLLFVCLQAIFASLGTMFLLVILVFYVSGCNCFIVSNSAWQHDAARRAQPIVQFSLSNASLDYHIDALDESFCCYLALSNDVSFLENPPLIAISHCPGRAKHRRVEEMMHPLQLLANDLASARSTYQITTIVTMLQERDFDLLGLRDAKSFENVVKMAGLEFVHFPIRDRLIPSSLVDFVRFILELRARFLRGERLLIHCNGGKGRAATVTCLLLVVLGMRFWEARAVLRTTRPGTLSNPVQICYCLNFLHWYEVATEASWYKFIEIVQPSDPRTSLTIRTPLLSGHRSEAMEMSPLPSSSLQTNREKNDSDDMYENDVDM